MSVARCCARAVALSSVLPFDAHGTTISAAARSITLLGLFRFHVAQVKLGCASCAGLVGWRASLFCPFPPRCHKAPGVRPLYTPNAAGRAARRFISARDSDRMQVRCGREEVVVVPRVG